MSRLAHFRRSLSAPPSSPSRRWRRRPRGASPSPSTPSAATLSIVGIWTGAEQKTFQAVLDGFNEEVSRTSSVKYTSAGDNTPTVLSTAVAGGNPPDLAAVGQPGLVKQFAGARRIKPIDFVKRDDREELRRRRGDARHVLDGKLYGMVFKGANKSTVWYSTCRRSRTPASTPPKTWPELLDGRQDAAAPPACRRTRSAAPTAGR